MWTEIHFADTLEVLFTQSHIDLDMCKKQFASLGRQVFLYEFRNHGVQRFGLVMHDVVSGQGNEFQVGFGYGPFHLTHLNQGHHLVLQAIHE